MPVIPLALAAVTLIAPPPPSSIPAPTAALAAAPRITDRLAAEAVKLRPLVASDAARAFLDAVSLLPEPTPRTLHRSPDRVRAYSDAQFNALPDDQRAGLKPRTFDPAFYYTTGYGSPLIYARPLDLIASRAGWPSPRGKRILDFGYGSVGHLRLLASLGADVTGIEVEPVLHALYSEPGDTGTIKGKGDVEGTLRLLHGRWPAEQPIVDAAAPPSPGAGYDLFISKNTLKRGYIHPVREADPKSLINLGVDDETFLKAVHTILKPGGYALIYNLSPAQSPPDKPYLPHADGQCPFDRALIEKAGFDILEYDTPDTAAALDLWMALGLNSGKPREELSKDLFAWYTLLRRR